VTSGVDYEKLADVNFKWVALCLLLVRRETLGFLFLSLSLSLSFTSLFRPFSLQFSLSISKQINLARISVAILKHFVIKNLKFSWHVRFVKILSKGFVEISFLFSITHKILISHATSLTCFSLLP